ncbi:MAG TPA: beta-ketoacyl-ACP synthase III [Gemmatimonadales bacterium]|nr:beta-ketoacyl-ACP synthase III [Gemmatimonadales bacterium]
MIRSVIQGTGHAVPERVVTNDDLARLMDTSDEWIRERTGIQERHWIRPGETGVALAEAAGRIALDAAGIAPGDLDAIVYASSTPDYFLPGNGVLLQHALGAASIPALDIRMQCSGFIYALQVADAFIRLGTYRQILVVGQEIQSTRMDLSTRGRGTAVIFADGAGAVVLGPQEGNGRGILAFDLHGDGGSARKLWCEGPGAIGIPPVSLADYEAGKYFLTMDGREVFRHAVSRMPESVRAALANAGVGLEAVKLVIPHQANLRISEAVQKQLGLRDDQVYNNIQRFGNTTSATIPIALDECVRSSRVLPGDLLVFTAFGSGFLWGSCVLKY